MKIPRDFIAFDFETTGFAPPCKVIEIGAVKVLDGYITEQFQTFVNPCCTIPRQITELTGIHRQMVIKAPEIESALSRFLNFIGDLPIAAHNAPFDMKFLHYEARRLGYNIENQVVDTLTLSRIHFPGLRNHKLATVAQHIGIISEMEHRGLYDAMVVAGILVRLCGNKLKKSV